MANDIAVFLACPDYCGQVNARTARAVRQYGKVPCFINCRSSSLLASNANMLWATALLHYEAGHVTHFAMIHADVIPEDGWLDSMLGEMESQKCQVLSALVAIKDETNETSAARSTDDPWNFERIKYSDLAALPETFSIDDVPDSAGRRLLVNTGLILVDLRGDWATRTDDQHSLLTHFTINDRCRRLPSGEYEVSVQPEDWNFSRMAAEQGCKVMATRKLQVLHVGTKDFSVTV